MRDPGHDLLHFGIHVVGVRCDCLSPTRPHGWSRASIVFFFFCESFLLLQEKKKRKTRSRARRLPLLLMGPRTLAAGAQMALGGSGSGLWILLVFLLDLLGATASNMEPIYWNSLNER